MIECCGERQRECDGLKKWPLNFFIESLPVMLQVTLLLLACGLCQHMWSINYSVVFALISLRYWPQSCILHRDCGHQDVIVHMSIPNASIYCSLRLMGGGLACNCLSYRPPPTGALAVMSKHEHHVVRSARPLCPVAVYWDQWAYWSKTVDIRCFNQPEYQRDSLTCTLGLLTSTGPIRHDWCAVYAILRTLILCTLLLLYTTRYKMSAFRYPAML